MALYSRQYLVMQRIQTALEADVDLAALSLSWKIRKLPFHRGATWNNGAYISPLIGTEPSHENQLDLINYRILVGLVRLHAKEGDLETGTESSLAAIERIEAIFRNKGTKQAPASLRTINAAAAAEDAAFQGCSIEQADRFMAAALELGYDLSATIVTVKLTVPRFNSTSYGA